MLRHQVSFLSRIEETREELRSKVLIYANKLGSLSYPSIYMQSTPLCLLAPCRLFLYPSILNAVFFLFLEFYFHLFYSTFFYLLSIIPVLLPSSSLYSSIIHYLSLLYPREPNFLSAVRGLFSLSIHTYYSTNLF